MPVRNETPEPGIALVTIERPEKLNALTSGMLRDIVCIFDELEADPEVRVIVLTGAGERSFCVGADLGEHIPQITSTGNPDQQAIFPDPVLRFFSQVFKPIIAAVNGYCIGGGLEILQGTDIRLSVPSATFGLGEVRWGVVPRAGSHVRLPRQIPWAVAMEMLLTARTIDAERAREIGLINRIVQPEHLMEEAMELAEIVRDNAPVAVQTAKETVVRAMQLDAAFALEHSLTQRVFRTDDAKEGPRAFVEGRQPEYRGR